MIPSLPYKFKGPKNKYNVIIVAIIVSATLLYVFRDKIFNRRLRKKDLPSGGAGIPTDANGQVWSADADASNLYDAMFNQGFFGLGTDEEKIFAVLAGKTQDQLVAIIEVYNSTYNRDLIEDFQADLSGTELSAVMDKFAFII